MLHPRLRALLARPAETSPSAEGGLASVPIDEARQAFLSDVAALDAGAATPPPSIPFVDVPIPVDGGAIRCRIYRPEALADAVDCPAMLFLHGGGWTFGNIDSHDGICRILAHEAACMVVSVDYRLAPEHPFPIPLDDCLVAYRWLLAHADDLGIDVRRIAVGGDSAGGNLAFSLARLAALEALPAPAFQLLLYPLCDLRPSTPSRAEFARGYWLDNLDYQIGCYASRPADYDDPRASLRLASDLAGLPATRIVTAGFDPLRDEAHRLAAMLTAAGVPTEIINHPEYIHGFLSLRGILPEVDDMLRESAAALRRGLRLRPDA